MKMPVGKMEVTEKVNLLIRYKEEVREELTSILSFWMNNTEDKECDGFYGSINNENIPDLSAPKGIVLNSRILWAFSSACRFTGNEIHGEFAKKAFEYINQFFVDHEYGGIFWSLNRYGKIEDGKKQTYGLAFCIYGLAEYYKISQDREALRLANDLFECIEQYSHDKNNGGYIEAFSREWQTLADLRLSEKDDNEAKTMNTHLHIIEAYANLYTAKPDKTLREKIVNLLEIFDRYIINNKNNHLNLFMDDHWKVRSSLQSFGHDIEAAWLLLECAEIISYELYIDRFKELAVRLAEVASSGLDNDGGLWYEYEPSNDHLIKEKHSWPQAEAMVGFYNAFQVTHDEKYLEWSFNSWNFIKQHIKDKEKGEWYWGVYEDYSIMDKEKAGFWKCPYHNSRACMEIIRRIENTVNT
jgi:cellobiose epimerase